MKLIYKIIIKWLTQDLLKTNKEIEKGTFENLISWLKIIYEKDKRMWTLDKINWTYEETAQTLINVLKERNINKNLELIYDTFPEIENMWNYIDENLKSSLNFKFIPKHSEDEVGLRIVDWFIGFLRKLILNLNKDIIKSSQTYNTNIFVNSDVIDFMNKNKNLFIAFRNVINEDYWSTFTNLYNDHFLTTIIALNIIKNNDEVTLEKVNATYLYELENIK